MHSNPNNFLENQANSTTKGENLHTLPASLHLTKSTFVIATIAKSKLGLRELGFRMGVRFFQLRHIYSKLKKGWMIDTVRSRRDTDLLIARNEKINVKVIGVSEVIEPKTCGSNCAISKNFFVTESKP
ncbi:hypothetical protein YC2023_000589 [Brassica napus]